MLDTQACIEAQEMGALSQNFGWWAKEPLVTRLQTYACSRRLVQLDVELGRTSALQICRMGNKINERRRMRRRRLLDHSLNLQAVWTYRLGQFHQTRERDAPL